MVRYLNCWDTRTRTICRVGREIKRSCKPFRHSTAAAQHAFVKHSPSPSNFACSTFRAPKPVKASHSACSCLACAMATEVAVKMKALQILHMARRAGMLPPTDQPARGPSSLFDKQVLLLRGRPLYKRAPPPCGSVERMLTR